MAELRLPKSVEEALSEITSDPTINDGVTAMLERAVEFETRMAAKLTGVYLNPFGGKPGGFAIVRRGGAVAVTVGLEIRGFQGWRYRWWNRAAEVPFPEWKQP